MTKYLTLLSLIVLITGLIVSCDIGDTDKDEVDTRMIFESGNYEAAGKSGPVFSIDSRVHDFGTIEKGDRVSHTFDFTNEGDAPLIISNVSAGCGCTVTNYSRRPVSPGSEGFVEVMYDSRNREAGHFKQSVSIMANTNPNNHKLEVTGQIVQP